MGVMSVRLNKDEEEMMRQLTEHFQADKSTLVKKSLVELYENMKDMEIVDEFEKKEKVSFLTAEDILNS